MRRNQQATTEEIDMIKHALGLNYRKRWADRNYFAAGAVDGMVWDDLVARGLARAHGNRLNETMPYPCYSVTRSGAEAAGIAHKVPRKLLNEKNWNAQ